MNQLIWKELRENLKWGAALLIFLFFYLQYISSYSNFHFEQEGILFTIYVVSTLCGFAFGLLQIKFEAAPDRWAFLLHRPYSAQKIVMSKITVGIGIQFICWTIGVLFVAFQLAHTPRLAHPFYWFSVLPALITATSFIPAYLLGLLFLVWKPRWKLARILTFSPFIILLAFQISNTKSFAWTGIWLNILIILSFSVWGSYIALECFSTSGELKTQNFFSRLSLSVSVSLTIAVILLFTTQIIVGSFSPAAKLENEHKYLSTIRFGSEGQIYQHNAWQNNNTKKPHRHELKLYDEPDSNSIIKEIPTHLTDAEVIEQHFPQLALSFTPKETSRFPVPYNEGEDAGDPLIRTYLTPINSKWPHSTTESSITANFSQITGLIHLYGESYPHGARETTQIGRNGFFSLRNPEPVPFGKLITINQHLSTKTIPAQENKPEQQAQELNDSFLLVCEQAIFKITPTLQTVSKVYEAEAENPIVNISIQDTSHHPFILIEHQTSFKIFTSHQEQTGSISHPTFTEPFPIHLYTPYELQWEVFKPEILSQQKIIQICYIPNRNSLAMETVNKSSSFLSAIPVTHNITEINREGTLLVNREIEGLSEWLNTYNSPKLSDTFMASMFPPVITTSSLLYSSCSEFFQFGTMSNAKNAITQFPNRFFQQILSTIGMLLLSTVLGQWYCNRKLMSPAQKKLTLWTTILCGPAGVLAIWFMETPPHRVKCSTCDKLMSVADVSCRKCGASVPQRSPNPTDIITANNSLDAEKMPVPQTTQLV